MNERKLDCLQDCRAACCRDVNLLLTGDEYETLRNEGAVIYGMGLFANPREDGREIYRIAGDCIFLADNSCRLHNKPEQPQVCREVKSGSRYCRYKRREGLPYQVAREIVGNEYIVLRDDVADRISVFLKTQGDVKAYLPFLRQLMERGKRSGR